jgi:3-hydroxyacyl-[acyl-carrier-protein] dehydratase
MKNGYGIERILKLLPHRYPFLLVDQVLEFEPGNTLTAFKNVTINESFFQGHFPGNPIMPGVMILEAMVQAGALLLCETLPQEQHSRICFSGVDNARFRAPVVPGQQLVFDVKILKQRQRVIKMYAETFVNRHRVAEAEIMALIGGEI